MYRFLKQLGQGDFSLGRTFLGAHLGVWLIGIVFFQLLSAHLSMALKRPIGLPLGLIFVAYNILAFLGVIRSARQQDKAWFRLVAPLLSFLLLLLSLWIPLYFYGRPLLILSR